jgi:hypothetical protein
MGMPPDNEKGRSNTYPRDRVTGVDDVFAVVEDRCKTADGQPEEQTNEFEYYGQAWSCIDAVFKGV